jgi:hypothetical protein
MRLSHLLDFGKTAVARKRRDSVPHYQIVLTACLIVSIAEAQMKKVSDIA